MIDKMCFPFQTPELLEVTMDKMQQLRSSAIRVFFAEANQMNCQLVENVFKSKRCGVCVTATASSLSGALDFLRRAEVDVLVISAQLQEGPLEGYRLLRQLRSLQSRTSTVMLLDSRERDSVVDAFRCGARGVIFRDEPLATLVKCIRVINEGQIWVNSEHLSYLLDVLGRSFPFRLQNSENLDILSKREADVVRLVAQGLTNRDISNELRLSEHTIRNYLFHIFDKMGVSTRVELTLCYLQALQHEPEVAPVAKSPMAALRNATAAASD